MTNTAIIQTITTTERLTYVAGTSLEEHARLLREGYTFDWRAQQYRRTTTKRHVVNQNGELTSLAA